ncbi:hypothetical protein AKJ65_07365 [candidate division MSBL1 archaeon SCGC-AAA259E19]|uniref:Phosphoesterase n=2 Tax=candidate division MSBL1 TaxID=215777 RepID=A0A133V555_9EURY|nr:hypothetical protein AKJ65_07365 [candidate division MSBL1 archaeon SCGC-AAA259E19]KXB01536.1 hypothetical protein AKJ41_01220 [candidate division MSBL1 archaeon SCGC-AAA259O05]
MEKIGLIADVHANLNALEAVLEDMSEVDKIICAGDLVGFGPRPEEVVDLLKSEKATAVLGDLDHAVVSEEFDLLDELSAEVAGWTREELGGKNMNFLSKLPRKAEVKSGDHEIFVVHGTPQDPLEDCLYPGSSNRTLVNVTRFVNSDAVVLGHTHVPMEKMIQGKLIVNPGSVGQPRDRNPEASYAILRSGEEVEADIRRVSYDIEETEQRIRDSGLPKKFGTRLHFGW